MDGTDAYEIGGRCLCGAVRLAVKLPTAGCDHCHCESCRRAHAAAFVTWVSVPRDQLVVSAGDRLTRFASSPGAWRSFCGTCGTAMLMTYTPEHATFGDASDLVYVPLAVLDGPLDRLPASHVSFEEAASWFTFHDDLPRYVAKSDTPAIMAR